MNSSNFFFNLFRHFFVALMATLVLSSVITVSYQYLGMIADSIFNWKWPFLFMSFARDSAGSPTGYVNWSSPEIKIVFMLDFVVAVVWAVLNRNNFDTYIGYHSRRKAHS